MPEKCFILSMKMGDLKTYISETVKISAQNFNFSKLC